MAGVAGPWECPHCGTFLDLDDDFDTYQARGSPPARFVVIARRRVVHVCWDGSPLSARCAGSALA